MRLIYKGENEIAAVLIPAPKFLATLTGTNEEKLIHLDLSDRAFRDAWTYTAGSDEKTSADLSAEDLAKYNMKENL